MTQVSVAIVTYNSASHIARCLTSLAAALASLDGEILVYDNASTDDTLALLWGNPDIQLVPGVENVGFARACNELARQSSGEYILFLNPDTQIDPDAVRRLLAAAGNHPAAGLYGAQTVTFDGEVVAGGAQRRMTLWSVACFATGASTIFQNISAFNPEGIPDWDRSSSRYVDVLSGGALLIRRQAWDALGGFDSRYFMYAEDADLCERARRLGHRPLFVADALVRHEVGGSSAKGIGLVLLQRGKVTYVMKFWPIWKARLAVWMMLGGAGLRAWGASRKASSQVIQPSEEAWIHAWRRRDEWRRGW